MTGKNREIMNETEILEEYLKGTDLTIKELFDRGALSAISQAITAYHLEQMRVKESDSLPCVRLSLLSCDEIKKHISRDCRNTDGSHAMDEQTYYEGAKWYREQIIKKGRQ